MAIVQLKDEPNAAFPPLSQAAIEPNGLLAWGGDLSPQRLLNAYRNGIFPWFNAGQPILWWSPRPRAVLFPGDIHISRRLKRRIASQKFKLSADRAFAKVIHQCGNSRKEGTWITPEMEAAYTRLYELGYGHSIEVWLKDKLVGGLYGLAIGKVFFAESMFSLETDASKVALAELARILAEKGFKLIDCQILNPHLASMGAVDIPRRDYIKHLKNILMTGTSSADWQSLFQ